MMYGGSLSSRLSRGRDDLSIEFEEGNLDQRLPAATRGGTPSALARLAELGVSPGCYTGAEQSLTAGSPPAVGAAELATCTIRPNGTLAVTSRDTGEVTAFTWFNDRWCWSPYPGLTLEATPRRLGALLVIEFVACQQGAERPAARLYLAKDPAA